MIDNNDGSTAADSQSEQPTLTAIIEQDIAGINSEVLALQWVSTDSSVQPLLLASDGGGTVYAYRRDQGFTIAHSATTYENANIRGLCSLKQSDGSNVIIAADDRGRISNLSLTRDGHFDKVEHLNTGLAAIRTVVAVPGADFCFLSGGDSGLYFHDLHANPQGTRIYAGDPISSLSVVQDNPDLRLAFGTKTGKVYSTSLDRDQLDTQLKDVQPDVTSTYSSAIRGISQLPTRGHMNERAGFTTLACSEGGDVIPYVKRAEGALEEERSSSPEAPRHIVRASTVAIVNRMPYLIQGMDNGELRITYLSANRNVDRQHESSKDAESLLITGPHESGRVWSLAVCDDGAHGGQFLLAAAYQEKIIRVWRIVTSNNCLHSLRLGGIPTKLELAPRGKVRVALNRPPTWASSYVLLDPVSGRTTGDGTAVIPIPHAPFDVTRKTDAAPADSGTRPCCFTYNNVDFAEDAFTYEGKGQYVAVKCDLTADAFPDEGTGPGTSLVRESIRLLVIIRAGTDEVRVYQVPEPGLWALPPLSHKDDAKYTIDKTWASDKLEHARLAEHAVEAIRDLLADSDLSGERPRTRAPEPGSAEAKADQGHDAAPRLDRGEYGEKNDVLTSAAWGSSVVLSIDGRWGTGKTVLAKLIIDKLRREARSQTGRSQRKRRPEPVVLWFDAWKESLIHPQWWTLGAQLHRRVIRAQPPVARAWTWLWWQFTRYLRPVPIFTALLLGLALVGVLPSPDNFKGLTAGLLIVWGTSGAILWHSPFAGRLHGRASNRPLDEIGRLILQMRRWTPLRRTFPQVLTAYLLWAVLILLLLSVLKDHFYFFHDDKITLGGLHEWTLPNWWFDAEERARYVGSYDAGWYVLLLAMLLALFAFLARPLWGERRAQLVVVIDELDRCNPGTTVQYIEAIHSLLRSDGWATQERFEALRRLVVRYRGRPADLIVLVLADGHHVRTSFSGHYKELAKYQGEARDIGASFIQKVFDHVIIVPDLSEKQVEAYVRDLIPSGQECDTPSLNGSRVSGNSQRKARSADGSGYARVEPEGTRGQLTVGNSSVCIQAEARTSGSSSEEVRSASHRTGSLTSDDREHVLMLFKGVAPANPRLLRRMVNTLGMLQQLQRVTGHNHDVRDIARSAILLTRFPAVADDLLTAPHLPEIRVRIVEGIEEVIIDASWDSQEKEERQDSDEIHLIGKLHNRQVLSVLRQDRNSFLQPAIVAQCLGRRYLSPQPQRVIVDRGRHDASRLVKGAVVSMEIEPPRDKSAT